MFCDNNTNNVHCKTITITSVIESFNLKQSIPWWDRRMLFSFSCSSLKDLDVISYFILRSGKTPLYPVQIYFVVRAKTSTTEHISELNKLHAFQEATWRHTFSPKRISLLSSEQGKVPLVLFSELCLSFNIVADNVNNFQDTTQHRPHWILSTRRVWLSLRPPIISYRSIFKVQLLSLFEFNCREMIDDSTFSVMNFIIDTLYCSKLDYSKAQSA